MNLIFLKKELIIFGIFFLSPHVFGDSWHIQSSRDTFLLERVSGKYVIKGKPVTKESVNRLLSLLESNIIGTCPEIRKGPLVVITKNKETKWEFFLDNHIVRKGDNCLRLNHPRFYSVPLHRIWFTASSKFSFNIKDKLKIQYAKKKLNFTKKKGWWEIKGERDSFVNHRFLEKIEQGLSDMDISGRYHPGIVSSKVPPLFLSVGRKKYKIVYLKNSKWGFIYPKKNWVVSSPQLQVFKNFSLKSIFDPNSNEFKFIVDMGKDLQERVDLMRKYRRRWNPNIIWLYKTILMNQEDNNLIRIEASDRLIEHPTRRVLGILVRALKKNDDRDLQVQIVKHLRAIHPKGAAITPDDSNSSVAKKLIYGKNGGNPRVSKN